MNDWERLHRQAEEYKESYPPGTRVMLLHMNDPYHPIDDGMRGTVDHVDDGANIHMRWDNGRTLGFPQLRNKNTSKECNGNEHSTNRMVLGF